MNHDHELYFCNLSYLYMILMILSSYKQPQQQHDDHYCILDSASTYYDEKKAKGKSQFLERVFALTFTSIIFFKKSYPMF